MRKVVQANNCQTVKKHVDYEMPHKAFVEFTATGVSPVVLLGKIDGKWHILDAHPYKLSFANHLQGFDAIRIESENAFGLHFTLRSTQLEEPTDLEPPPPPPESNNLLAKMRSKMRQEMGVQREAFLERENLALAGYEIGDDEAFFEEDLAKIDQREMEKRNPHKAETAQTPPAESAESEGGESES